MNFEAQKSRQILASRKALNGVSRFTVAAALCVPAMFYAGAAAAQSNPEAGSPSDEIVVTAQFREQSVQKTPIAITAINAQQLEARGQTNIVEVAQQAPNVNLQASNPQGPSLQAHIRGIGQTDFNTAFEPGVGLYVDDVYFSTMTGSLLDLLDLDRVEVLRGPQGTLAGMNSIGGAIKMYSKKPDGNGGGYVEATVGSLERTDLRAGADFTIVPDRLFARLAGVSRNQKGYVTTYDYACTHPDQAKTYNIPSLADGKDCVLGTEGGKSYTALRGSLRWLPTDNLEVNINADVTRDRSEAQAQTLIYVGSYSGNTYAPGIAPIVQNYPMYSTAAVNGLTLWNTTTNSSPFVPYSPWGGAGDTFTTSPYVNYSTYADAKPIDGSAPFHVDPVSRVNGWGVSGNIDYSLSDTVKLTSITAYRTYKADWVQDFDASPLSNAILTYHTSNWQFSEEARLAANLFDDKVDLVVGGFYIKRESTYSGIVDQGSLIFTEDDTIPASDWAAFANASWRLTDKLELNAGIRYSEEQKSFLFGRGGHTGAVQGGPYQPCIKNGVNYGIVHVAFCGMNGVEGSYSGSNVDYRAILQYQWTPDVMTYASIATGYKGGGVNPRPYYPDQARPFDPEHLTAYEVGLKSSFLDHRVRMNLSAFVNKYSDFIANVFVRTAAPPNTGCFFNTNETLCAFYVNAGKATLKGVELEMTIEPADGFLIDASGSLLDFKYDYLTGCSPVTDPTCPAASGGLGAGLTYDMKLPYAPERKFSIGAQYTFDMGSGGRLTPRFDLSYQSDQGTSTINHALDTLEGYTLLNGKLTWNSADSDWQVGLQVTNITNKLYYTGLGANNNAHTVAANPAMPREWSLSVKRSF